MKQDIQIGIEFVEFLKNLTDTDRIFWQQKDLGKKEKSDIAYLEPWMICLDTDSGRGFLQVAESYKNWAELKGADYGLGALSTAIGSQYHRVRQGQAHPVYIEESKIQKFTDDKLMHEKAEMEKRAMTISQCLDALRVKNK